MYSNNINQHGSSLSYIQKTKLNFQVNNSKTLSLPKTAPPSLNPVQFVKKEIKYSSNKTPDIKPFQATPFNIKRISKNQTKDRYIREWAFKSGLSYFF
jgi:hypothetical protein